MCVCILEVVRDLQVVSRLPSFFFFFFSHLFFFSTLLTPLLLFFSLSQSYFPAFFFFSSSLLLLLLLLQFFYLCFYLYMARLSHSKSSASSASPHSVVGMHYKVGRKIGEGSFGIIYEGLFILFLSFCCCCCCCCCCSFLS